jgi:hypothetical protein
MLSLTPPGSQSATTVVSPRVYALIARMPDLCARLLPEGLIGSPYEILDYEAPLAPQILRPAPADHLSIPSSSQLGKMLISKRNPL